MTEKNKKKTTKKGEKQTRYLSQAIQLEEAVNPHIIRSTMSMVSLAILAFIIWAAWTNVNEVARTPGEVVPHGYQQTVQHLEGGIVDDILVMEGEVVKKGQILISIDEASLQEDLKRAKSKQLSLELQAERLRAFVESREPDFSPWPDVSETIKEDQISFFNGMRNARETEEQIIHNQIAERKQSIRSLETDLETAQTDLKIAKDMYNRRQQLNQKGYASDILLLENERQTNDTEGQIKRLKNQILVAKNEIEQYENRLHSLSARHRDEAYEKLAIVESEKQQNIKIVHKFEERMGRLQIRAPADGLIKGLTINTIGAVIQPGQTLMEIVPIHEQLEVQVKISPQDIGHLKIGQPVQVKFSTYDFSRYGSVQGQLEHISATTFAGDRGERYYQGRVMLEKNYVGNNPNNLVMPGMTVMADIITGKKTILQYLLKPIHISLRTAFTER